MRLTWRLLLLSLCLNSFAVSALRADDETTFKAIDAATQAFVQAFNRGDQKAMAGLWTPRGDYIGENGERIRFRDQIGKIDEQKPDAKAEPAQGHNRLTMTVNDVRLVTPNVATADGTSVFRAASNSPAVHGRFTATWVLQNNRWLLDSVRENHVPTGLHHAHLSELQWLVGTWEEQGGGIDVETQVRWSEDGNYLIRTFKSEIPGRSDSAGTQRIGWDAKRGQLRSWTFRDDGGFSHGLWTATDYGWEVEISGVTADGKSTGSIARLKRIDDNTLEWESTEATLNGQPMPDLKLKLIRKTK